MKAKRSHDSDALTKPLTTVELEMMNVIWRLGPCSVTQVREQLLPERDLAYTSVSTIIRILEQKGYVKSTKAGKAHSYEARVSKESYQTTILALLVNNVFDGTPFLLVRHLLDSDALKPTEIAEIKALLRKES